MARHNDLIESNNQDQDNNVSDNDTSFIENRDRVLDTVDITKHKHRTTCRLCQLRGNEETPVHLALDCPATWRVGIGA